ncbi:MAG: hypothetical protein WCK77_24460 [Verrucomicrobiota bacterium]
MPEVLSYRCPFCDREVRVGRPCPGCAKKQRQPAPAPQTSWRQDAGADGLDLPDGDFDYDEFVAREFGRAPHRRLGVAWYWWLLGVLLLATLLATWVVLH